MILDTNAVSAILSGDAAIERLLARRDQHELPAIVMGEYLYGLRHSRHRKVVERHFHALIEGSVILDVDGATAIHYATIRSRLRAIGRPIPENDVWIASLAAQHDLPIVTRDAHFRHVEGIAIKGW